MRFPLHATCAFFMSQPLPSILIPRQIISQTKLQKTKLQKKNSNQVSHNSKRKSRWGTFLTRGGTLKEQLTDTYKIGARSFRKAKVTKIDEW